MVRFEAMKSWFFVQLMFSYAFIVSGLIINFLQLLLALTVRPFDVLLHRKLTYYLNYSFYSNMVSLAQWWSRSSFRIFASDEDARMFGHENAIVIVNHKYDVDWLFAGTFLQRINMLGGIKVVTKNEVKYVPIVGWLFYFAEYIFVKRNWQSDRDTLTNDVSTIFNFPKGYYYSIGNFCEGTRFTKEKHAESMKIVREKGLPELKHHLLPRTKGFYLISKLAQGRITHLYDCTMGIKNIDGHSPGFRDLINGRPLDAQLVVRRISLDSVPLDDEKKCGEYLFELYQEKDQMFDVFHRTGDFALLGIKEQELKPNRYDLYNSLFWCFLVLGSSFYGIFYFIWNGSWTLKFALTFFMFLINLLMKYLIYRTDVKSTHGLAPSTKEAAATSSKDL